MKPETAHSALRGLTPAVTAAGVLAVLMISSALAGDSRGSQGDFVLLSMEQAALYHGTQMPGYCNGTANRPQCMGTSRLCSWYSFESCPYSAFTYPENPVRYCTNWVPGPPPGGCTCNGMAPCYTQSQCIADMEQGVCKHPWWGWVTVVEMYDDVCTTPTPVPIPPPPKPEE